MFAVFVLCKDTRIVVLATTEMLACQLSIVDADCYAKCSFEPLPCRPKMGKQISDIYISDIQVQKGFVLHCNAFTLPRI